MFDSTRKLLAWTKQAVTLLVGWRPVPSMPIRGVLTTKEPGDHNRFIHFEGVVLGGRPEWVRVKEGHKVGLKIGEGRFSKVSARRVFCQWSSTCFLTSDLNANFERGFSSKEMGEGRQ